MRMYPIFDTCTNKPPRLLLLLLVLYSVTCLIFSYFSCCSHCMYRTLETVSLVLERCPSLQQAPRRPPRNAAITMRLTKTRECTLATLLLLVLHRALSLLWKPLVDEWRHSAIQLLGCCAEPVLLFLENCASESAASKSLIASTATEADIARFDREGKSDIEPDGEEVEEELVATLPLQQIALGDERKVRVREVASKDALLVLPLLTSFLSPSPSCLGHAFTHVSLWCVQLEYG